MTSKKTDRVERLISFRELERTQAGLKVSSAQSQRQSAEDARELSQDEVRRESDSATVECSCVYSADRIQLSIECLDAARSELALRQSELDAADTELEKKTKLLLDAHHKVRQMETLFASLKAGRQRDAMIAEQREVDDLVTTKEAWK